MRINNTSKHGFRRWWKKNSWTVLFSVLSAIASAIIGYLVGFNMDGFTKIKPTVQHTDSLVCVLNNNVTNYRHEVNHVSRNIFHDSNFGRKCKIGLNPKLPNHFISVAASNNPYNLEQDEKVYITWENKDDRCFYTKEAFVQISDNSPKSEAIFFMNKRMLSLIGINSNGIHEIYFKRAKKN